MWMPPPTSLISLLSSASTLKLTFNSLSKSFELNVLFSQNLATSTVESDQREDIWPFGMPHYDPGLLSHLWLREELGAGSKGKGSGGFTVLLLRALKIWSLFASTFKRTECSLTDPMQLQAPSTLPSGFCGPELHQTVLQPQWWSLSTSLGMFTDSLLRTPTTKKTSKPAS